MSRAGQAHHAVHEGIPGKQKYQCHQSDPWPQKSDQPDDDPQDSANHKGPPVSSKCKYHNVSQFFVLGGWRSAHAAFSEAPIDSDEPADFCDELSCVAWEAPSIG